MKTIIVNDNNIGIQTKNGVFEKLLMPGKYCFIGKARKVEIVSDEGMFCSASCSLETLLKDANAAGGLIRQRCRIKRSRSITATEGSTAP